MATETIEIEVDAETARLFREVPPPEREAVSAGVRLLVDRIQRRATVRKFRELAGSISARLTIEEADEILRDIELRS